MLQLKIFFFSLLPLGKHIKQYKPSEEMARAFGNIASKPISKLLGYCKPKTRLMKRSFHKMRPQQT